MAKYNIEDAARALQEAEAAAAEEGGSGGSAGAAGAEGAAAGAAPAGGAPGVPTVGQLAGGVVQGGGYGGASGGLRSTQGLGGSSFVRNESMMTSGGMRQTGGTTQSSMMMHSWANNSMQPAVAGACVRAHWRLAGWLAGWFVRCLVHAPSPGGAEQGPALQSGCVVGGSALIGLCTDDGLARI